MKIGYNEKEQRLMIPYWKNGHVVYWVGRDRSGEPEASKYKKAYLDGYNENIAWGLWTFDEKHRKEIRQRLEKNFAADPPKIAIEGMANATPYVAKIGGSMAENEDETQKKIISLADRQKMLDDIGVVAEGAFDALSFEQEGFKVLSPISGYFNKEAKKLSDELKRWHIKTYLHNNRLILSEGDNTARNHYKTLLSENPEVEIKLILELIKSDCEMRQFVEERAAIREADGLPGDLESAVRCNFQ